MFTSVKPLMVIVFLLSVICLPTIVQAAPQIEVVSHSSYIDGIGYYNIVGEVHNTGDQAANYVGVTATFYNAGNEGITTRFDYIALTVLLPDRKSPFRVEFVDIAQSALVDHYSLAAVEFTPTDSIPKELQITSHNSTYSDSFNGLLTIIGEIENTGDSAATYVRLIATGYDEAGNVVDEVTSILTPTHIISANQKATFEIEIMGGNANLINSYELTADSENYALIPEFNSYLLTILSVSLISVSLLIYKRKITKK